MSDINDTNLPSICDKIFDILEIKFDKNITKFIISILLASRSGCTETEIVNLLENSSLVKDSSYDLWIKFCWFMGPLLMHNKNITLMDGVVRNVGEKRYQNDIIKNYKTLEKYYEEQQNQFVDKTNEMDKSYNLRKLIELPYHTFKLNDKTFETSLYLIQLKWIYDKINATGCVHLLNDISLTKKLPNHLIILKKFLQIYFKALNYDAQQFYSMLGGFLNEESKENNEFSQNGVFKSSVLENWREVINEIPVSCLERLHIGEQNIETVNSVGYDLITNIEGEGYFVISMSTDREEICVWDVAK